MREFRPIDSLDMTTDSSRTAGPCRSGPLRVGGECSLMRQPIVRRFVIAITLATILFLAHPGAAQARDLRTGGAWGWLQQLWTQGIARLWAGPPAAEPAGARGAGELRKDGLGMGWPRTPLPDTLGISSDTDQGHGMDPNG
jgi:hypothetical protein